jgi:prepilin-type N-terminal cleavage/methylation domain-containing protein
MDNEKNIYKYNEKGFSLIELMFSMFIFSLITGTMFGLLELGRNDGSRTGRQSDALKNARLANYLIGRDIANAGLGYHKSGAGIPDGQLNQKLGTPLDGDGLRDVLTSVSVGNDVLPNSLDSTRPNDSISLIYRNLDFNNGSPIKVINEVSTSASKIIAQTVSGGANGVNIYDVFLAENDFTQVLVMVSEVDAANNKITFTYGDPLGINQMRWGGYVSSNNSLLRKCSGGSDVACTNYDPVAEVGFRLKKVVWIGYKVDSEGTLNRYTYGNNTGANAAAQIQVQPLVYGIQSMQFEYGMKDGTVSLDPAAGVDGIRGNSDDDQYAMNLIRQATLYLEIQASQNDEKLAARQIVKVATTFSTRNLQYDDR